MIKTNLIMVYCKKKSELKTSDLRTNLTWIYESYLKTVLWCNRLVENYNMHVMNSCFHPLGNREHIEFATCFLLIADASYQYLSKVHYATKQMVCRYVWYLYYVHLLICLHNLLSINFEEIKIILYYLILSSYLILSYQW